MLRAFREVRAFEDFMRLRQLGCLGNSRHLWCLGPLVSLGGLRRLGWSRAIEAYIRRLERNLIK